MMWRDGLWAAVCVEALGGCDALLFSFGRMSKCTRGVSANGMYEYVRLGIRRVGSGCVHRQLPTSLSTTVEQVLSITIFVTFAPFSIIFLICLAADFNHRLATVLTCFTDRVAMCPTLLGSTPGSAHLCAVGSTVHTALFTIW